MLKCKHIIVSLSILFFISCAGPSIVLKDQLGRKLPDPHYVLQGINNPITVLFYYTAFQKVVDVDNSIVFTPFFLDLYTFHNIDTKKYEMITLTIEVNNPENLKYSLYEKIEYERGDMRNEYIIGGLSRSSDLQYRQYVYNLPFKEEVKYAKHLITLTINDQTILQIGEFQYNLLH